MPAVDVSRDWPARAEALSRSIEDGAVAQIERSVLWVEIERAEGAEVAAEIAAELELSESLLKAERYVGRAWIDDDRPYPLSWSHYRAVSGKALDGYARHRLMERAVDLQWTEKQLMAAVRAELAATGAGTTDTPHDPPDPTTFADVGRYVAARFVEQGMARAKADEFVASYGRYAGEWERAHGDN